MELIELGFITLAFAAGGLAIAGLWCGIVFVSLGVMRFNAWAHKVERDISRGRSNRRRYS